MNLSEALDAALPEIPAARLAHSRPPRLDPDLVVREDVQDGQPFYAVLQRDKGNFFRIPPFEWQLAQLFDGARSYDEIASTITEQSGVAVSLEYVRLFADSLGESDFWYKTPQERNLALSHKLTGQRGRRANRSSAVDLSHIDFSHWDPDRYLTWLNGAIGNYLYSPWCVMTMVLLFLFETTVFVAKWGLIGPDALLYYNFTQKSLLDLAQFWALFLIMGFIHESAHGLTCKHFGGQVHAMGLMFLYLMPAFFCDVTEVWISATKIQRLFTILAGIWAEMVVCGLGMIVWLNSQPGQWIHDFAYQIILITGLAVVFMNLNPLIKLDGYFFLTEILGMPDLKERSTAFLSGWFQSRVLRLDVEMPIVPRRRAPFFMIYAFLSGAYSYTVLFILVRLTFNITSHWMADWAVIPAGALAFKVFRSRLRSLAGVIGRFWKQHIASGHLFKPRNAALALVAAALLFLPLLRDRENAWYVIEPLHSSSLHAAVPGRVDAVLVREGESVHAGQPLLRMSSLQASSMQASAKAQTGSASYAAFNAELHGESIGPAAARQAESQRSTGLAAEAQSSLDVAAISDGVVLTEDPAALLGQEVGSGQSLLDLADAGPHAVRIYIPAAALQRIPSGAEAALVLPDHFSAVRLTLEPASGDPVNLPSGLIPKQNYKGIKLPLYYAVRMALPASAGAPLYGVGGPAKIFGVRRSLAGRLLTVLTSFIKAHVW